MDFSLVFENYEFFIQGIINTITLVSLSLFFGAVISVPLAILRAERHPIFSPIIWGYTYFFRGTPLLIQAFLIYYGLGQFEFVRDSFLWPFFREAWYCALLAFTLNTAAYTTEIFRGAIEATPLGEVEAAKASGMSRTKQLRRVVLPSAFRRALPAYTNEVIFMLHGSVVASTITVVDILGAGRIVNGKYYVAYEGFISAAILYMILVYLLTRIFNVVEWHWTAHLRPRVESGPTAK